MKFLLIVEWVYLVSFLLIVINKSTLDQKRHLHKSTITFISTFAENPFYKGGEIKPQNKHEMKFTSKFSRCPFLCIASSINKHACTKAW